MKGERLCGLYTLCVKSTLFHADRSQPVASSCCMTSHYNTRSPHITTISTIWAAVLTVRFEIMLGLQATGTSLQMAPVAPSHLSTTQPLTSAFQSSTRLLISHSTAQLNPRRPSPITAPTLSPPNPPRAVQRLQSLDLPQPLTQPVCTAPTCSACA